MAVFNGTGGNDSLIGTDEDDIFNESSLGQDVLVGGGGYDTAIIDYSGIGQQAVGGSIGYSSGGLHSMIQSADQSILVDTYEIEKLDIKTGSLNNGFQIDLSQVFGWSISVDAGGGQDYLSLTMYYDSPALVGNVTSGFTSGNLTIKNFEQFYLNLGMGNDHLTLGSGHDTVKANAGDDYIDGGDGNDLLEGNLGGDTLIGGAGDDGVYAWDSYSFTDDGSERDILSGGAGNDTVSAGYGDDADGGTGTDVLSLSMQGGPSGAVLDLSAVFAGGTVVVGGGTIKGFESYGNIYGTNFDDTITTGNAAAIGSLLNRGVFGYGGNDTITTGIYEDSVHGMEGNDVIRSGGGNDRASGGDGNDQVYGEAGNDTLWGGDGDDLVQGADGNDNILGGFGADQITGDAGDDSIDGEGGDDLLYGGAGKDTLIGGGGVDRLEGGANDDIYVVDDFDTVVELAGGGIDEVRTYAAVYSIAAMGEIENLTGISWPFVDTSQTLIGNDLANRIDGAQGADRMEGGLGNDTYIVADAGDVVVENADAGIDEVQSSFSYTLGANVENLKLNGYETNGYGNDLANVITGTDFDNILFGNAGNDQLIGGNGADILAGGDGNDTINGGTNEFWAFDIAAYTGASSGVTVNLTLTAAQNTGGAGTDTLIGIEGVSGSSFNDTLLGNTAANAILGEAGNDALTGGAGADRLTGGDGDDTFRDTVAGLNGDTITDFAIGDKIIFSNATLATFTFKLTDTTLTYSGGSLTLEAPINGTLLASAAAGGGVQLTIQSSTIQDVANDFNGDGRSDILFHHDNGAITNFLGTANGGILNNGDNIYTVLGAEWHVAGTGDFNGDGRADILWRDDVIFNVMFTFLGRANGGVLSNGETSYASYDASWTVSGIGDFNGDGRDDILFRDANGIIFNYLANAAGGFAGNTSNLYTDIADAWHVSGVGDFNGDGRDDILFRNDNGAITNFLGTANGGILNNGDNIYTVVDNSWHIAGTGDFNGDGRDDILWRNDNGAVFTFLSTANGGVTNNGDNSYVAMSNVWHVEAIGDYNGDGRDDILWRHDNGTIINWLGTASGGFTDNSANLFTSIALAWQVAPADALI